MGKIFSCIISFLLSAVLCMAQQKDSVVLPHPVVQDSAHNKQDSLRNKLIAKDSIVILQHGLRFGIDISRFVMPYLQPNRRDAEISADMEIKGNWYGTVEGGFNTMKIDNGDKFRYHSKGYFFRLGADYNFLNHTYPGERNMLYAGFRIGHAQLRHGADNYVITDPVWGNVEGQIPTHAVQDNWLELVAGLKIEALKNFFMGWSLRARFSLTANPDKQLPPYVIPGFGKGANKSNFDFNYSLYYRIPLFSAKERFKRKSTKHATASSR